MASDVDIVNAALTHLGQRKITDIGEDSAAGKISALRYQDVRDATLRGHRWNFAIRRTSLAAEVATPEYGYALAYTQPAEPFYCLRVLEVEGAREDGDIWKIEGRSILTDLASPIKIQYVWRNEDPETYDSLFREALAAALALDWAEKLTKTSTVKDEMERLHTLKMAEARSVDGQEDMRRPMVGETYITSRL